MKIFKELKQRIYDTYLCVRFPFLYPRDRKTDRHHVHFTWINRLLCDYERNAYTWFRISYVFYNNPEDCTETNRTLHYQRGEKSYTVILDQDNVLNIYIDNTDECIKYDLQKHVGDKFTITGISVGHYWYDSVMACNNMSIVYHCHRNEVTETNYGFAWHSIKICDSKYDERMAKLIKWIWYEVIDRICVIPGYTELDAMPDGWRKAFGIQMCKDIKHSLLHTYIDNNISISPFEYLSFYWKGIKQLYGYRIDQIKEKFGGLRWYDSNTTKDILEIIDHYEDVSMKTCIVCGKPATYMAKGWISPYCDEHIGDKDYATRIENT